MELARAEWRKLLCGHPGGLHIEMAGLKVIGDWLEDSGWVQALKWHLQELPIHF